MVLILHQNRQIRIRVKIKNQVLIRHMKIVGIYSTILICTLVVSRLVYMQCVKEGVQEIENYHTIVIYVNEKKLFRKDLLNSLGKETTSMPL